MSNSVTKLDNYYYYYYSVSSYQPNYSDLFPRMCSFLTKAINAELAGAVSIIITDNNIQNDDRLVDMAQDGTSRSTDISAFFLSGKDGWVCCNCLWESMKGCGTVQARTTWHQMLVCQRQGVSEMMRQEVLLTISSFTNMHLVRVLPWHTGCRSYSDKLSLSSLLWRPT